MMSCRSPSTTADNQTLASLVETMEQTLYHESLAPGAKLTVLQDYIRKMKATLQIADPYDEDTQLPDDILLRIMLYLDGQTLCKMMQTNRRTHRLILQYEQLLWRTLTESRWLTLVNDNHILSINPHSAISKSEPRAHTELSHIVAETQSLSLSDKKQSRAGRASRASGHSFVPEKRPWAGYFIDNTLRWKDIYEQFWNVYCGNYRFMIVMDYKESYRRHLMNDSQQQRDVHRQDHDGALWQHQRQTSPQRQMNRKGGNLRADVGCRARGVKRDRRRYVLQCGQPTQATSGYAVNLRLCGKYLCWISDTNLAVCEVNGHTPEYLSGHMAALICLSTNQRNIAVTGAEDHDVRVWDLSKRMCIGYFPGVDCLDVAVHEEVFVTYSNDNIICIWDIGTKTCLKQIDLKLHEDQIDRSILAKEVKIDFWGTNIVCGFENTTFLVVSTKPGEHIRVLMEPSSHFREELDSSAYPTVLSLYNSILVTRGIRWNEICVWDICEGRLLYRLSESSSYLHTAGTYIKPTEVITDVTMDSSGSYIMCTVESASEVEMGQVYLLVWDFRPDGADPEATAELKWGEACTPAVACKSRPRGFEKRSLESIAGDLTFDYTNFWLCYE